MNNSYMSLFLYNVYPNFYAMVNNEKQFLKDFITMNYLIVSETLKHYIKIFFIFVNIIKTKK